MHTDGVRVHMLRLHTYASLITITRRLSAMVAVYAVDNETSNAP